MTLARPAALCCLLAAAAPAWATNVLAVQDPTLDRPTVVSLGVQLPITDDDNFNATVALRYRKAGATAWRTGLPLYRVHPEYVAVNPPPPQFAGSVFDLEPDTAYELELHAVDPDGTDVTKLISGRTAAVPSDPATPRAVNVTNHATLQTAVANAAPGDVITLADGAYGPALSINKAGTATNPIVIRGQSQAGVVFDAAGCATCNAIELYGAGFVHLENLTIRNAQRAIRVQSTASDGVVFRRLLISNVQLGITTNSNANGYYVADNVLQGRLTWPSVYKDDNGAHANDDGINIRGSGNVIAHNRISGFGDAMKTEQDRVRANDFYGNDVLTAYDNGLELDTSQGNVRAYRNRFMNNSTPLSFQPIEGGPAYVFRNVVVNVADEPFKLHALLGVRPPAGGYLLHNTVVKAGSSLQLSTPNVTKEFRIENNLFIANPSDGFSVRWDTPVVDPTVTLDYNGYFPDGKFELGYSNTGTDRTYANFAAVQASGRFEQHGLLVGMSNFDGGLTTPAAYTATVPPADVTLAPGSLAVDQGLVFENIDDGYTGAAPDLGALERGCPVPAYGPRPVGVDERTLSFSCAATSGTGGGAGGGGGGGGGTGGGAGGGAGGAAGGATAGGGAAGGTAGSGGGGGGSEMTAKGCACASDGDAFLALAALASLLRRRRSR